MAELLTIGETMATFTPGYPGPLRYADNFHMRIAGAESNTAIGAAKLGIKTEWYSRLGDDEFGRFVCNRIRSEGVRCDHVVFDEKYCTGIMFKEQSAGETRVTYYRKDSAASGMSQVDLKPEFFSGTKIIHMTGITPVLSSSCREMTEEAFALAKKKGIDVSFDPNIRQKLWKEDEHKQLLKELALDSDILLMGKDEGKLLFGTEEADHLCDIVFTKGRAKYLAVKNGEAGAVVSDREHIIKIPPFPCRCLDPVGAGDGFNAGFLAGILSGKSLKKCGQMAGICGALATQCTGDVEGYPDKKQMEQILSGTQIVYR